MKCEIEKLTHFFICKGEGIRTPPGFIYHGRCVLCEDCIKLLFDCCEMYGLEKDKPLPHKNLFPINEIKTILGVYKKKPNLKTASVSRYA